MYRTLRSPTELEATPLIAGLLQARAPCTLSSVDPLSRL